MREAPEGLPEWQSERRALAAGLRGLALRGAAIAMSRRQRSSGAATPLTLPSSPASRIMSWIAKIPRGYDAVRRSEHGYGWSGNDGAAKRDVGLLHLDIGKTRWNAEWGAILRARSGKAEEAVAVTVSSRARRGAPAVVSPPRSTKAGESLTDAITLARFRPSDVTLSKERAAARVHRHSPLLRADNRGRLDLLQRRAATAASTGTRRTGSGGRPYTTERRRYYEPGEFIRVGGARRVLL